MISGKMSEAATITQNEYRSWLAQVPLLCLRKGIRNPRFQDRGSLPLPTETSALYATHPLYSMYPVYLT